MCIAQAYDMLKDCSPATPTEQVEHIDVFDTYERGLIAHVQGLQDSMSQINPYEGKEGDYPVVSATATEPFDEKRGFTPFDLGSEAESIFLLLG
ncbi:Hypothetical protein PHPALM_5263 [Phytophthora palmivora]|uniref:Uncharacterized protein n=1 Tax=Phytophthora palmivora TaxID=4796 RepID=A0A2P4YHW1_9STRA|nr:Hypothetical protein PHPALM_5263 [Phytophthora palmivora]